MFKVAKSCRLDVPCGQPVLLQNLSIPWKRPTTVCPGSCRWRL